MAGVRVTQPPSDGVQGSGSTTPDIDTQDIDYSAGAGTDVRERQRFLLAGSAVNTDVAVMATTPAGTEEALVVRQAGALAAVLQSNAGVQAFVKATEPAATDAGLVVRQAGPIRADLQVGGTDVGPTNKVPISGPVGLLGPDGNPISTTNRLPVDIGGATVQATFSSFVSTANSTQTPLAANATFTGAWEDVKDYAAIIGSLVSDQPSAINGVVAEFALDAAGTQLLSNQTTTYPGGGVGAYFAFSPEARYVRIRYTNGATAQTYLRSQVAYEFTAPVTPQQALGGQLTDANVAGVQRSAITGRLSTGQWVSLLANSSGHLSTRIENSPVVTTTDVQTTGTLTAAATSGAAQTLAPLAGATAVQMAVPDGHQSSQIYISGTFSATSQVFFEGSADGTDASWFALNHRRNPDATTNEESTLLDSNPFGGPSPVGAGLSNWRGSPGGVRFLRVRCGAFTAGDSIVVKLTTSHGGGPVFQQGPPPLPSDFYATGALAAPGDTVPVKTSGAGAWSAIMVGNFTGTVYFEQTVDNATWRPINGAVAGVGTLQTQISGTNTANQSLSVRGSCGGLARVRLRAGTDFLGSFNGTIRAGAGSGGVFLTAPVPIAGLSNGAQTLRQVAGTGGVATRVDPSPLATRTSVEVKAMSTNSASIFVGFTSGVTTGTGREVLPGEAWTLDVTTATPLYAVAASANQGLQVTEVG